jgi:chemotaxis protein CheC
MLNEELTEEHEDALTELVNIGIGRAAYTLSEMVDSRVGLRVPKVCFVQRDGLSRLSGLGTNEDSLSVVLQPFSGGVAGTAVLVIPRQSARRLVAVLTDTPSESTEIDVEREGVLTEVGNIVINSVLGSLGNMTSLDVDFGLPRYEESAPPPLVKLAGAGALVMVSVLFEIQSHAIEGELAVMFELPSLGGVWALLDPAAPDSAVS